MGVICMIISSYTLKEAKKVVITTKTLFQYKTHYVVTSTGQWRNILLLLFFFFFNIIIMTSQNLTTTSQNIVHLHIITIISKYALLLMTTN